MLIFLMICAYSMIKVAESFCALYRSQVWRVGCMPCNVIKMTDMNVGSGYLIISHSRLFFSLACMYQFNASSVD